MNKIRNLVSALLGLVALAASAVGLAWLLGPQGPLPAQQVSPTAMASVSPIPTPTPEEPLPQPVLEVQPAPPEVLAGEKIAFLRAQDLWLVNVASRALAQVSVSGNVTRIYGWSHDSSQLLLGVGERPVPLETDMPRDVKVESLNYNESLAAANDVYGHTIRLTYPSEGTTWVTYWFLGVEDNILMLLMVDGVPDPATREVFDTLVAKIVQH